MDYGRATKRHIHPREKANVLSKITFFYTRGLFWKTYKKKKLEEDDLYQVPSAYRSQNLGDEIEKHVEADILKHKTPSIYRILWSCYGREYLIIGLVQLVMRTLVVTTIPLTLSKLVLYFDPNQQELTKTDACFYALILIILNLINVIYLHNYMLTITAFGIKVRTAFCSLMYRKSLKLTSASLSNITMGKIVTLMTKDVGAFEMIILYGNDVWIGFVQAGIVCYLIYRKMGVSAFVGVGIFLLILPFQIYIGKKASKLRMETGKKTDERLQLTKEALSSIKFIKMYAWENVFQRNILSARNKEVNTIVKIFITKITILLIGGLTSKVAFYFLVMTYVWLGYSISAELVFFVLTLFQRLRHALSVVIPIGITESAELYAAVERIGNLLKSEDIAAMNTEMLVAKPKVILQNVTVNIKNQNILKNITLTINSGLTVVSGTVGSGKTTLLKTFLKHYIPTEGTVSVNGTVSYASQEPWVFPSTLRQNIVFGEKFDRIRYEQVLRVCALNFDIGFFKTGDNMIIGDKGLNLSQGQKARINLARAVYKKSDIYLLDDCLTALDAHVKEYAFNECIKGFLKDKICILVTHNIEYMKNEDNLIVMEDGRVKSFTKCPENNRNYIKTIVNGENIDNKTEENTEDFTTNNKSNNVDTNVLKEEETKLLVKETDTIQRNIYHEVKKSGKVSKDVYNKYISFGGGHFVSILILMLFILSQWSKSYTEKMVSNWVDLEQNISQFKTKNLTNLKEYNQLEATHSFMLTLFSVLIAGTVVLSIVTAYAFFNFTRKASKRLHKAMIVNIINAVTQFFDSNFIGNILNRFSKDLATIDEQFPFVLYEFSEILFALCGIIILLATVNLVFLLPVFLVLVTLILIRKLYMPTGRNLQRLDTSTRAPIIGYLNASLEGLSTIRAFNAQKTLTEEFDKHQDLYTSANYTLKCYTRAFGFAIDAFCSMFIAVIITYFLIFDNDTTVGNVGLAITQSFMLSGLVQYGVRQWAVLENMMTSVERVLEYTNKEQEVKSIGLRLDNWPEKGKVRFDNVSLVYQNSDGHVLKNINFSIDPMEKIGIVGRTGAGKTSITSILFRLYNFEGTVTIDDVNIKELSLDFLRRSIAIIPQDPVLFTGTIRSNIDPIGQYSDDDIWAAIEKVKLKPMIHSLDFKISESSSNFSSGQKQLLCLARAIVSKNKIIVLDEATASMDDETDTLIHNVIKEHFRFCTVITIAHKLGSVLNSDKVMVIENGTLVEFDKPDVLLKDQKGSFYKMVEKAGLLKS